MDKVYTVNKSSNFSDWRATKFSEAPFKNRSSCCVPCSYYNNCNFDEALIKGCIVSWPSLKCVANSSQGQFQFSGLLSRLLLIWIVVSLA